MASIRNDSAKVAEAHRQAEIIEQKILASTHDPQRSYNPQQAIADALLDIWQENYVALNPNAEVAKA